MKSHHIIFKVLLLTLINYTVSESPQKGPFRCQVVRVGNCSVTAQPLIDNGPFILIIELDNKTGLVNGNVTILENDKTNLKLKVQLFLWENGEWHLSFHLPGYSCNRPFTGMLLTAMRMKGNREKCSLSKGFYSFKNIDVNKVNHLWLTEMDYGKVLTRTQVMDKKHTLMCMESILNVTPK